MKNIFKFGIITMMVMTLTGFSSCRNANAVDFSDDKKTVTLDSSQISIVGTVAFIPMVGSTRGDNTKEILMTVNQFSIDNKVKVLHFNPDYKSSNQTLYGIWVAFEPIKTEVDTTYDYIYRKVH